MEIFLVLLAIAIILVLLAKGMGKLVGPFGCLVVIVLFFVFTCQEYNEQEERERIGKEKAEKAWEDMRKTKQQYRDSGWLKNPKM